MNGPPADAYENPQKYGQLYWDPWFPQHCYGCHIAAAAIGETCGVHCGEYFSEERLDEP